MRKLHDHYGNPLNNQISIHVTDEPGLGGANQRYEISGYSTENNPSEHEGSAQLITTLLFQNGPISVSTLSGEVSGINGITNEVLLTILIDRLKGFQSGPFSCRENELALTKLEEAHHWLKHRTADRIERGVEGTLVD